MSYRVTSHVVGFTTAQPGWEVRLTYKDDNGEYTEEHPLVGWVTTAEVNTHVASSGRQLPPDEQFENMGLRSIKPAWFDDEYGELMFRGDVLCADNLTKVEVMEA
jgi:hypothetical protein